MKLNLYSVAFAAMLAAASSVLCRADDMKYNGADPLGTISYSLPSTSFLFEVEAECEAFYAGPYARFADKYLGMDVRQKNENTCRVTSVRMTPFIEADQSARYVIEDAESDFDMTFLQLTSCGLVSVADSHFGENVAWRFPAAPKGGAAADAIVSNLSSEAATLYRKGEGAYGMVAVQQNVTVAKTLEQKAAETASLIFELRKKRMQIITGDTDATYSGEAMGAAVEEITRLEKEYMTMFTGYSVRTVQTMTFDIVPEKDKKMYVAFRVSETAGLLPADDISGKPVALEIIPQVITLNEEQTEKKKSKNQKYVVYRIPAVCTLKLTDGKNLLFQSRQPVYQFGVDSTLPLTIRLKSKKQ